MRTGDWRTAIRSAVATLLDAALPASCVICRRTGEPICDACCDTIPPIIGRTCTMCGAPVDQHSGSVSATRSRCETCRRAGAQLPRTQARATFDGTMREVIHALKYNDRPDVARSLARLLEAPAHTVTAGIAPVVVPVPLHVNRLEARGYDQAELLATHLARECGWPLLKAIMRTRDTPTQVGLGRAGRRANVVQAFSATSRLDGKSVLLVDDVMTTGATLTEVARTCRAVGAIAVVAVCAARDLSPSFSAYAPVEVPR